MTTVFDGEVWICDVLHSIECKGGGGSQQPAGNTTTTTVQKSDPWSGQQPYLQQQYGAAQQLFQQGGPQYFPGQTLASTSPLTNAGINMTANIAQQGNPLNQAASNSLASTLNGNFLDPSSNPYLTSTYNTAADQLEGRMRSAFGGSDVNPNTNSSLQAATGLGLSDLGNQIYGGNYQAERTRMDQAAALAPQVESADYLAPSQLTQAGLNQQSLSQAQINDAINRYNYNQNLPYLNLQNYAGMIAGNPGGSATQTATTPYFGPSSGANVLGGALGGAALGSMIMPGIGTAAGAGIGGLLSLIR